MQAAGCALGYLPLLCLPVPTRASLDWLLVGDDVGGVRTQPVPQAFRRHPYLG